MFGEGEAGACNVRFRIKNCWFLGWLYTVLEVGLFLLEIYFVLGWGFNIRAGEYYSQLVHGAMCKSILPLGCWVLGSRG